MLYQTKLIHTVISVTLICSVCSVFSTRLDRNTRKSTEICDAKDLHIDISKSLKNLGNLFHCEPRRGEARNLDSAIGTQFFRVSVCVCVCSTFSQKTN